MASVFEGSKSYFMLVLLCLLLYIPGITALPPVDRDEARFAQATRQMIESHDFVRIRFQDQPRYKKPIGIYWLQAAAVLATGKSASGDVWPYRLPSMLGAMIAVLLLFEFARRQSDKRTAMLAAVLCAASLILVLEAHVATTDAVLLAATVAAQGALMQKYVNWHHARATHGSTVLLFWVAQGVGILIKGPILPLITVLTILGLVAADRKVEWLKGINLVVGVLVVTAIVAPWGIAIGLATKGEFYQDAIGHDLLPKLISGQESHGFPPGYYLGLMPLTFWPGSIFAPAGLAWAWKSRSTARIRFSLAWLIPAWILFEMVPTKLPHYVLPIYPALALLTAEVITAALDGQSQAIRSRLGRIGAMTGTVVPFGLALGALAFAYFIVHRISLPSVLTAATAFMAGIICLEQLFHDSLKKVIFIMVLGPVLIFAPALQWILPNANAIWLSRSIAYAVEQQGESKIETSPCLATAGYDEPSLVFLLGTGIKLTSTDQAALFLSQHPDGFALIDDKLDAAFQREIVGLPKSVTLLDKITGYNYSKGRKMILRLYSINRGSKSNELSNQCLNAKQCGGTTR